MGWRIGVDSGGTFTDICLFEDGSGNIAVWKVPSTPADPSHAVAEGVREALTQGAASKRRLLFRSRDDRGDQCADPASRRTNRLDAESARGVSPRAAHRSGLDTLASSGSC